MTATRAGTAGRGVLRAVANVRGPIADRVAGMSALDQEALDSALIELDGTPNKSALGANAILGVSLAAARAAARSQGVPLYAHLGGGEALTLPVPMFNIINGGRHAANSTDFQEFLVVPAGFESFALALRAGVEVYHALRSLLVQRGMGGSVGDEGGFAPSLSSNREAVELILSAIELAGYTPGAQCFIALDVAASEIYEGRRYALAREGAALDSGELIARYAEWSREYPLISIEDGMAENDWDGWQAMTSAIGSSVQLVGDDLFTTNTALIQRGLDSSAANRGAHQAEPDRHADRDAAGDSVGRAGRMGRRDKPPLRRDRGHDHRGPGGRHRGWADQGRRPSPLRAHRQVQPAAAHRGGARGPGELRRTRGLRAPGAVSGTTRR